METLQALNTFFTTYGWQMTLIAIAGIVVLGILKYCNVFSKLDEEKRHYLYIIISAGLSIIATTAVLIINGTFSFSYLATVSGCIYALNQAFYTLFKVTPIKELFYKLLDVLKKKIFTKTDTDDTADDK